MACDEPARTGTCDCVTVPKDKVCFDAKGRAMIEDEAANKFIKATLEREASINICSSDVERTVINMNCPCHPNTKCGRDE